MGTCFVQGFTVKQLCLLNKKKIKKLNFFVDKKKNKATPINPNASKFTNF